MVFFVGLNYMSLNYFAPSNPNQFHGGTLVILELYVFWSLILIIMQQFKNDELLTHCHNYNVIQIVYNCMVS